MPFPDVIQALKKQVQDRGDLPVLRDTVILVLKASEDQISGAADVARIITQDEGFMVKVLKVVNSVFYNQTLGEISSISKAVVVLGLDNIRTISLGLSFVELFEKEHPKVDLKKVIAGALTAAILAREFAKHLNHPEAEKAFTAAVLHNLGPISLAYYLPEAYIQIRDLMETSGLPSWEAEQQILGTSINQIGITMAKEYNIPDGLVESLVATEEIGSSPARTPQEQIKAISYLANRITNNLLSDEGTKYELDKILQKCDVCLNIGSEKGVRIVKKAYNKVNEVSESFGVELEKFKPSASVSEIPSRRDNLLGSLRRTFEIYEKKEEAVQKAKIPDEEANKASLKEGQPSPEPHENETSKDSLQLKFLRDLSWHLVGTKDINIVFNAILEGIHRGIGFDRAILAFCDPSKTKFNGRYGIGPNAQGMAERLSIQIDSGNNIFRRVYSSNQPVFVEDVNEEKVRPLLPDNFLKLIHANAFVVSPIHAHGNIIGFFYADKALSKHTITQEDYRSFQHFVIHANIALERISVARK